MVKMLIVKLLGIEFGIAIVMTRKRLMPILHQFWEPIVTNDQEEAEITILRKETHWNDTRRYWISLRKKKNCNEIPYLICYHKRTDSTKCWWAHGCNGALAHPWWEDKDKIVALESSEDFTMSMKSLRTQAHSRVITYRQETNGRDVTIWWTNVWLRYRSMLRDVTQTQKGV